MISLHNGEGAGKEHDRATDHLSPGTHPPEDSEISHQKGWVGGEERGGEGRRGESEGEERWKEPHQVRQTAVMI